ncbi:DUF2515 family protein [Sulfurirhabdus autotrophica]|uniref:Uncharacterized protein n=1 Tax=Sulfurirhabdus autotrophica TaxID=1706046 RepID=A0A4R3YDU8_9PROT|nr:hypothetical protein [Sulfurirhabdus autotrophica]TCV90685.1 hypothetical protein EDC63_101659 [Sulfurirhabdus autotrophica]
MADPTTITAMTNTTANSCVGVQCDCNTAWSIAQQWSTLRLCTPTGKFQDKLVSNYAVRARRIAATYARFYLELEDGCDVTKKGRFYWMALGAFASKTVACSLEDFRVTSIKNVKEGLGKGNLWLFCDISGWHWYYTKHPSHFDQCLSSRSAANYVPAVQKQMNQLPWKSEALPKINNMQVSGYIKDGFAFVKQIEEDTVLSKRQDHQLKHLLKIADHEQGVILQPLIYDAPDFAKWVGRQRSPWVNWASPKLELVFTHACITDNAELKSVAPEDIKLEELKSRMNWIGKAAERFHFLMKKYPAFMENELRTIAIWMDMSDK